MSLLVSLRDVTKSVTLPDDSELQILKGVSLDLHEGDRLSVVGRSGGGKSTLLNLLGLLDVPTSGDLEFLGLPARRMSEARRARVRGESVGFVFQQFNLLPERTALENVMTPLYYATGRDFWRRRELALGLLDRVGLSSRAEVKPVRLSGGEQQRVAIARALVRRPRLILADEPTGALDVETGQAVMSLLEEVAAETSAALVTITHDRAVADRSERQLHLNAGVLSGADDDAEDRSPEEGLVTA
ncbi:ABC transporter ATP-binding protein [Arthrobacter sp. RAF14]|uniref:ABC transporter ATP-binding protein n=1 Tax=Arthrobacter sp. RAF14 TaxID=3233051 RepID=UPI003F8FDF7F